MDQFESTVRVVRTLHVALLVPASLYPLIGEKVGPPEPRDVKQIQAAFFVLAVVTLAAAAFFRWRWMRPPEEGPGLQPEKNDALGRWRIGNIVSFVLCESVALYGLVLRMLGGTLLQSAPFYVASVLLLLAWIPRRDFAGRAQP